MSVLHQYEIGQSDGTADDRWFVRTTSYAYEFLCAGREILSYHWHPDSLSPITFPHLHVGNVTTPVDLSKAHLPTGLVSLQAVLRFAIAELGVQPLRRDWPAVLNDADGAVASHRSHH